MEAQRHVYQVATGGQPRHIGVQHPSEQHPARSSYVATPADQNPSAPDGQRSKFIPILEKFYNHNFRQEDGP